jgi:hypothetical protein
MNIEQTKRLEEIKSHSPMYHGIFKKAYAGNSKATALRAKCLDCCCWQRTEVAQCTAKACPLWLYRPYQDGDSLEQEAQP